MIESTSTKVTILSVGPMDDTQIALAEILSSSGWPLCPGTKWSLESCSSLRTARPVLQRGRIPIVVCDRDHRPDEWKQMLEQLRLLPDPPFLIVTSRLADDRLWAEALNLGAYDVLAKPFEPAEVVRIFSMAWLRWAGRDGMPARVAAAAAGSSAFVGCDLPAAV